MGCTRPNQINLLTLIVLLPVRSQLHADGFRGFATGVDAAGTDWGRSAETSSIVIYDNSAGGSYFVANDFIGSFLEELRTRALGSVASRVGARVQSVEFGLVSISNLAQVADAELHFWNEFDDSGAIPGAPVNADWSGGFSATGLNLPANFAYSPRSFTVDLSARPGGGIFLSDELSAVEFTVRTPGTSAIHWNVRQLWSAHGTIGSSDDDFFFDGGPHSDHDATFDWFETYYFGGGSFAANLYLRLIACIPCDTNCDGSVNSFDIQPFLGAITGSISVPCSPCNSDANGDGTVSPFDIDAFINCMGS